MPADALVTHRGCYNDRITQVIVHFTVTRADFLLVPASTVSGRDEFMFLKNQLSCATLLVSLCFRLLMSLSGRG